MIFTLVALQVLLTVAGLALVAGGLWWAFPPLVPIVFGAGLAYLGVVGLDDGSA